MNAPEDFGRPQFWDRRYEKRETPWDFHGVPRALRTFLELARLGAVLIPGCGPGHEVRAFHEAGWKVTAIDFSPVAVEQARGRLGDLADCVVLGDFFKHDLSIGEFDLVYERTFLCALSPHRWPDYAQRVAELLRPGGRLAGIFFHGEEPDPPPYPLPEGRAHELFGARFSLKNSEPVTDSLTLFAGREWWQEWEMKLE